MCFGDEIGLRPNDAQKTCFQRHNITLLYVHLLGLCPRPPSEPCAWTQLGDFRPPDFLLSYYTPPSVLWIKA